MGRSGKKQEKGAAYLARANELFEQNDIAGAIRVATEGLALRKNDPKLLGLIGVSYLVSGNIEAAIDFLEKIPLASRGGDFSRTNLAGAYFIQGRLEDAHRELDEILRMTPDHEYALSKKGAVLNAENRLDEAEELLAPFAEGRERVYPGIAMTWAQLMLSRDEPERAIEIVRVASEESSEGEQGRVGPAFMLAQLLEKAGRFDEAFDAYELGNRLKNKRFSVQSYTRDISAMLGAWSREVVERLPRACSESGSSGIPVFIIGMPRSGTSLVEQILSTLGDVFGAGELDTIPKGVRAVMSPLGIGSPDLLLAPQLLTRGIVDRHAEHVLHEMRAIGGDAERITDKTPGNVFHLGYISAIFPNARVIHCVRDPIDTCLSCYSQNFDSAISFAYNLADIGAFYNEYRRAIAHWKDILDLPIYDVVYEDLVADPEPEMRGLVEFLGLEWDLRCLEFHKQHRTVHTASNDQVRRPLYTSSVAKWKRYEKHLTPLLDSIDDAYLV